MGAQSSQAEDFFGSFCDMHGAAKPPFDRNAGICAVQMRSTADSRTGPRQTDLKNNRSPPEAEVAGAPVSRACFALVEVQTGHVGPRP